MSDAGIPADCDLVHRVVAGDHEAYMALVDRYQDRLRLALAASCHSHDELEEILQDAFVTAFEKLSGFDPESDFYPWLKTIALNALRMEIRRKDTRRRHSERYLCHVLARTTTAVADLDRDEDRGRALAGCIAKLPPAQASLLEERYRASRSIADLARNLGVQVGTIKTRLSRLRQALRDCVEATLGGARA